MSIQNGKLISIIIEENFGKSAEKVASYLFKWGTSPLSFIAKNSGVPFETAKRVLCFFIKYGFVTFEPGKTTSCASYTLLPEKILLRLRYCCYIDGIKKTYGNDCELIFDEILRLGMVTASEAILSAAKRKETEETPVDLPTLRDALFLLISKQYVMRCPIPLEPKSVPVLKISERELFLEPTIDIQLLDDKQKNPESDVKFKDENILWRINFDRCHQDMRDSYLVNAMKRRIGDNGEELMQTLLKLMYIRTEPWAELSNPIPVLEVKNVLKKKNANPTLIQFLEQYMNIMDEDSAKFIQRVGDTSGGQYVINIKEAFTQLAWVTVENIVLEKYGSNAARIFRLVRAKKFIEGDHIQQLAMIPNKDAKRITYLLLEENLLQMRELRKTQIGPVKTFILFYINFDQVVRMLIDVTYKCIYNLIIRRHHFMIINNSLIKKKQRADAIELDIQNKVQAEELDEILSELITPSEKEMLEKIGKTNKTLNTAALKLDETLFLFQLYLLYTAK